jgi:hypothetical protein
MSAGMAQGVFSHKVEGIREQIEDLQGLCRVAFRLVDQMARQETPEQRKKLYAYHLRSSFYSPPLCTSTHFCIHHNYHCAVVSSIMRLCCHGISLDFSSSTIDKCSSLAKGIHDQLSKLDPGTDRQQVIEYVAPTCYCSNFCV